jgi:monofunctional biosynthetic peptidoglycan transglycosylase
MRSFRRRLRRWMMRAVAACALLYLAALAALAGLRFVDPPFTMVHAQRRFEALYDGKDYAKRYTFLPLNRMHPALQHAVIAAEDTRFFQHRGFDWKEVREVIGEGEARGASTITQQLVKNLFFTTRRSAVRKVLEASLVWPAELILGKRRILELYLNVIEWGPGVYGAEAAARHYYGVPAASIGRERAARLAAILPNPLRRRPERMEAYAATIQARMRAMGW